MQDNNWLQNHRWNITSQRGEDGVLAAIFNKIDGNKYCIECGAGTGKYLSNTWRLINESGWESVQIEADTNKFNKLVKRYGDLPQITCLNATVGAGIDDGMDYILSDTPCPLDPDLCVIDIDGYDYWVWFHMQKYRPKVVMIEFNPTIPFWAPMIQDADSEIPFGCSLITLVECGKDKRYELISVTDWNAIFITEELFPLIGISDNSLWALARHIVKTITYAYQSYDNKVYFNGNDVRFWDVSKGHLLHDLQVKNQIL
jgi:hypothetical protein